MLGILGSNEIKESCSHKRKRSSRLETDGSARDESSKQLTDQLSLNDYFESEKKDDDEVRKDVIQFKIEFAGKHASSCLKEILLQIQSLEERLVPVEILNVPDTQILKLERIIERNLHEIPEYIPGKFILKTPQSSDKGSISINIAKSLNGWNGGISSLDSIMTTDQNQRRAPDIEWRQTRLNFAQRNNSALPRPMPELWIEICYNRTGDRDSAFEKIQAHLPSQSTVFVAIVLACKVTEAMLERMGEVGVHAVLPSIAAAGSEIRPRRGPYIAVWTRGTTDPVYYDVRRGYYLDLQITTGAPIFRFDMDWICQGLQ
jgi:hypothetical protein